MRVLRANWFLFGIIIAILLAYIYPPLGKKGGPIRPEYTVKYLAVGVIFLCSGITLRTDELRSAITSLRLHATIQIFSLLVFPIFMVSLVAALRKMSSTNEFLLTGLVVVGCMPPPVSSAVILTKGVGGNEAGAIFNSAFGSLLGIIVTPFMLLLMAGIDSEVPLGSIFTTLTSTVLIPLILGQVLRHFFWQSHLKNSGFPFSEVSSFVLLVIIYSTFCDTFSESMAVAVADVVAVGLLILMVQMVAMFTVFALANYLRFPPRDIVCIVFCAVHKSLTLGIPMLKIVFAGHPSLSLISLPLLVYHPTQILFGGMLVPGIRSWMETAESRRTAPK